MNTQTSPDEVVTTLRRFALARHRYVTFLARSMGMSRIEFDALDYIQEAGVMTPAKLADLLCVTGGAVTSLVDKLEAAGYVTREQNKEDRRSILIRLTVATEGAGAASLGNFVGAVKAAAVRMTPEQREATVRLLEAAADAANDGIGEAELERSKRLLHKARAARARK